MGEHTGVVDFTVESETFQTWYTVFGDLTPQSGPLVLLHGGPGFPHHYLRCHARLWASKAIPVVLFDQLGCGQSTHLQEKPKEFWTVDLFIAELANLLEKLGIHENYDLLGHSWGGALAASYVLGRRPKGLKRLVLASTYPSMRTWEAGCRTLIAKLPEEKRSSSIFNDTSLLPLPNDVRLTIAESDEDDTVYQSMNGPSEWYITGSLKSFDIINRLKDITQPTLVINGAKDEATDFCVGPLFWNIPNSKWVQFAEASHMAFHEEADRYFEILGTFLAA